MRDCREGKQKFSHSLKCQSEVEPKVLDCRNAAPVNCMNDVASDILVKKRCFRKLHMFYNNN